MAVSVVARLVNQGAAPSSPQVSVPSTILSRLRLETRAEHDAVERLLDLMGASLTREAYRQRLAQFYGFYAPLEAALRICCTRPDEVRGGSALQLATLSPRLNKTDLLRRDLHYLGVSADPLPLCSHLPSTKTSAELLGCMYVLEGATLGGRLITQHIQATFGITPATGGGFFEGYAGDTGKMWQAMRHLLVNCASDIQAENAMVANAIATFACLRGWCGLRSAYATNDAEIDKEAN